MGTARYKLPRWRDATIMTLVALLGLLLVVRSYSQISGTNSMMLFYLSQLQRSVDESGRNNKGSDALRYNNGDTAVPGSWNGTLEHFVAEEYKLKEYLTDGQLLAEAYEQSSGNRPGSPRIAFLFLVRGNIHHEPIWRRFFKGHEEQHTVYVHATPGYSYPPDSIFHGKEIPSKPCPRFSRSIVDAFRRLLAYSLMDPRYNNRWFINVCESTIPLQKFPFVYEYLITSPLTFVESFYPVGMYHSWETMPEFNKTDLRKGELWMALERRHARVVIGDTEIFNKFNTSCTWFCTWDEQYIQTLLFLRDRDGIAKRTVMYVDWTAPHGDSPHQFDQNTANADLLQKLRQKTWDSDGERHDTAFDNTTYSCEHNGVKDSPCFLFARKFHADATEVLVALSPQELGY